MQKLYAYFDEHGLHTQGQFFVVAGVVTGNDRDTLLSTCENYELTSGKGKLKWGKSEHKRRIAYLRSIGDSSAFRGRLYFKVFREIKDFEMATIETIALTLKDASQGNDYSASIYVDALSKTKRHHYGSTLRKMGIRTHKIIGVTKDENNGLIRLADTLAGFVADVVNQKQTDLQSLFEKLLSEGVIREV